MNTHLLFKYAGGTAYFAQKLGMSKAMVSAWGSRGLPPKYDRRLQLIAACELLDLPDDVKQQVLAFVRDPAN